MVLLAEAAAAAGLGAAHTGVIWTMSVLEETGKGEEHLEMQRQTWLGILHAFNPRALERARGKSISLRSQTALYNEFQAS